MPILISKPKPFVPSVILTYIDDEDGTTKRINNRDLPEADQISMDLSVARAGDKSKYLDRKNETDIRTQKISVVDFMDFEQAVADHCHTIHGLEGLLDADGKPAPIRTGADLVKAPARKELNDIIQEAYHKIVGTHLDDAAEALTPGKSKPSE